jgi:hypothetical protein
MAFVVMDLNSDDLTISCIDYDDNCRRPGVFVRSQYRSWVVKRLFSDGSVVVNGDCADEDLIEYCTGKAKYPDLSVFADALRERSRPNC